MTKMMHQCLLYFAGELRLNLCRILALLGLTLVSSSWAVPVYEPFADATASGGTSYSVGSKLGFDGSGGQTNAQGLWWADAGTNVGTLSLTNVSGSLSFSNVAGYSGFYLPSSQGNSIFGAAISNRCSRMTINRPSGGQAAGVSSGNTNIFASFLLRIVSTNGLSTNTANFIAGFNNTTGAQAAQPTVIGSRLYVTLGSGGYKLGVGKSSGNLANVGFDPTNHSTSETLFIVLQYTFGANSADGTNYPSKLWVNPPPSLLGVFNGESWPPSATSVVASAETDISDIKTFFFLQRSSNNPAYIADELRVSYNWVGVTAGPDFATQPQDQAVREGSNAVFTASAVGTPPISYQWQLNNSPLSDNGQFSGSGTPTLTILNPTNLSGSTFSVVLSNGLNPAVTSSNATLIVIPSALVWVGTSGGLWTDTNNWSPTYLPVANSDVFITNAGSYNITLNTSATVRSLTLGAPSGSQIISNTSQNLTITGSATIGSNGQLLFQGGTLNAGSLTVNGLLSAQQATLAGAITISTNGTCNFGGLGVTNTVTGNITNYGTFDWAGGQIAFNQGTIVNQTNALFDILSDYSMFRISTNDPSVINSGTFRKSVGTFSTVGVTFTNTGTIIPAVGVLAFNGDLSLPDSSILSFPISGTNAGTDFGQLNLYPAAGLGSGAFRVGGTLNVTFTNSFSPSDGNLFPILGWSSYSGGFLAENWFNVSNSLLAEDIAGPIGMTVAVRSSNAPPALSQTNLISQIVGVGDDVSFVILPIGQTPFTYQWMFNQTNFLTDQTNNSLLLTNVQTTDAGTYCVLVTDGFFVTNTNCATLTVLSSPGFSTQPTNATVTNGASLTLSASATGNVKYQWRLNGQNIPGATNSTLTITNVQATNGGSYSVVAGNSKRASYSTNVLVKTVIPALPFADNFSARVFTNSFSGLGGGSNSNATRELGEVSHAGKFGSNSVWFGWTCPTNGVVTMSTIGSSFDTLLEVSTGSNISNQTVVAANDDVDLGFFDSKVIFNATSGVSYNIAIDGLVGAVGNIVFSWKLDTSISQVPVIANQPVSVAVTPGSSASFSVAAAVPNGSLSYQWYYNDTLTLVGATNSSLVLSNVGPRNVGLYRVEVTSTNHQRALSSRASLEIGSAPDGISADKFWDAYVGPNGQPLKLKGPHPLFPSVSTGIPGFYNINNYNATTDAGEPTTGGPANSSTRWYELIPNVAATMEIDTLTNTYINTMLTVWTDLPNYPFLTKVIQNLNGADGKHSRVVFTNKASNPYLIEVDGIDGSQGSIQINWRLGTFPTASNPAQKKAFKIGDTLSLQFSSPGDPNFAYQWRFNNMDIPGQTLTNFSLANLQAANSGTYSVVVSNVMGVVTNIMAVVSVQSPLQLSQDPSSKKFLVTGSDTQAMTLQVSTNLFYWTNIFTNPDSSVFINFTDQSSPSRNPGYYRLKRWP